MLRRSCLAIILLMVVSLHGRAQVINNALDPTSQQNSMFNQGKDSSIMKQGEWKEERARIYYNTINSAVARFPDTTIENFHRFQRVQPWWGKDLGNFGTAVRNQLFTPGLPTGLSLGYHIYDMYRLSLDSLRFYNTTRPYSAFSFMLGSKTEQNVEILHTQNITPNWNLAARMRYYTSAGFYQLQKANSMSGDFSSNYQSPNKRFYQAAGLVFNRHSQDENGGIVNDSLLDNPSFSDRQRIDVNFPVASIGQNNAAVRNRLADVDFILQNNYSFGKTDTVYTKDSTGMSLTFPPRFRIQHQLRLRNETHTFRDMEPSTARYQFIRDSIPFNTADSVYNQQKWFYVDNRLSLNGFLGKSSELVQIEAGIGNRIDRFSTKYVYGTDVLNSVGNYLFGEIKKEAFKQKQWSYQATAQFFFTGDATGNFYLRGEVARDLGNLGMLSVGLRQNLANAPYSYTTFRTNFYDRNYSFNKTSTTQLWGKIAIDKIGLQLSLKNYLIANYLYYDQTQTPTQQAEAFSVLQFSGRKQFHFGIFFLDNELAWQQATGNAPVHIPALLLRHKIGMTTPMFKSALIVSMGLEAKYHTPYYSDGYSPYFNQFYYQDTYYVANVPEVQAFFNFKIKTFRAFVIGDQLQQFFTRNVINAPGYPIQNAMFRFGFTWILIN